ncbi:hypothetical protein B0H66DRAFT_624805 [Apodospora peruviana]|uniref:Uncharacterized protein n=1 Tax=Apodospora peruviana TaxID=516989 RepID=A0AAE0M1P4_9PEZI|nr:hypothetical protein B0H66DRAFT_624805 [Apodospora peruviana]
MRASPKTSALVLTLAAAGFLAPVSVVSTHPLCSADSVDQNCRDGLLVDHWSSRRGLRHDHDARAFRLPGAKRPGDDTPENPGPSPKPKTEDGGDTPEGQSGPQAGASWGSSPPPPPPPPPRLSQGASSPEYNVENKGYEIEYLGDAPLPGSTKREPSYSVEKDGQVAAEIRTNKDEGSIPVETAFVGWEGTADRARLWEIQATIAFLKSGMKPGMKPSDEPKKEVFDANLNESVFGKNAQQFIEKVPVTGCL